MTLTLDYACQQCGELFARPITDLAPARRFSCPRCGGATEMTADALQKLRSSLDGLDLP